MTAKVSVIVPLYNSEKYLCKCIDSILAQTFMDFELFLVDDGSADNCPEICDGYAQRDKRIKVIHKSNGGVSSARNVGIEMSSGKYITFVDSDDYIDRDFFKEAIEVVEKNNADLYISGLKMETYDNGKISRSSTYSGKEKIYSIKLLLEMMNVDYQMICISGPGCKFYKADIIKHNNIKFVADMSLGEDTYFNMDYLKFCENIYFTEKVFYHYHRGDSKSLFSKYNDNSYEIHVKVLNKMRMLFIKKRCDIQSLNRFELLYVNLLIGCIHNDYRNVSLNNKKFRLNTMKKISNNNFVANFKIKDIKDNKGKMILFLLHNKSFHILDFIFRFKYLLKGEK